MLLFFLVNRDLVKSQAIFTTSLLNASLNFVPPFYDKGYQKIPLNGIQILDSVVDGVGSPKINNYQIEYLREKKKDLFWKTLQ